MAFVWFGRLQFVDVGGGGGVCVLLHLYLGINEGGEASSNWGSNPHGTRARQHHTLRGSGRSLRHPHQLSWMELQGERRFALEGDPCALLPCFFALLNVNN